MNHSVYSSTKNLAFSYEKKGSCFTGKRGINFTPIYEAGVTSNDANLFVP